MGISAVEHATKLGGIDVTLETEVLGDGTHPSTCRFATPRVVVLSRGGYLAHVVLATSGGELSDVQHDRIPSTTWLCAGAQARCGIGLGMSEPWSGQYELVGEPISTEGAGSLVQRARRLSDGEEFVLKAATGEYQRLRFEREIEVGLRLDHPHVMPIIDSDAAGLWFTMPIASGHALTPNAAIAPEVLLGHLEDIASGVEAGHAVGFIHRDLKPDNLLIVDGRLVVADWGIARNAPGSTGTGYPTVTGLDYGSWGWAAPELSGTAHDAGPAADVFSIGQIIGWVLTGASPNQGIPLLPEGTMWEAVVERCTRHSPDNRPATPSDLLRFVVDTLPIHEYANLLAELYRIADRGELAFVEKVERRQIGRFRFQEATWYPSGKTTNHVRDHEQYFAFLNEFHGEATRTFHTEPQLPVRRWSRSSMLDTIRKYEGSEWDDDHLCS